MSNKLESFFEAIIALTFLIMFATMVLPALQQATGQSMFIFFLSLIMIALGIIFSIIRLFIGGKI